MEVQFPASNCMVEENRIMVDGTDRCCWDGGGWLFKGGCNFSTKDKLKSGIFNDKKVHKQEHFALS